ncbi:DUF3261 domain-containing protein [Salinisphaera sp. USBA-960]|nr:DUF3261 domain-containing protein [Salifodinibacter halophilus]NNC25382.1 DUF3261 domain-containing protein [Salifodinibacter halophilus]
MTGAWLILVLVGCTTRPAPLLKPLDPGSAEHTGTSRQVVSFKRGNRTHRLQIVMQLSSSRLRLIGLSPLGQRLFTLASDASGVTLDAPSTKLAKLDPRRIVSDLELAYWPLSAIRSALPSARRIEQNNHARLVWQDHELVWLAIHDGNDRWQSPVKIYNRVLDYTLHVAPVSASEADANN